MKGIKMEALKEPIQVYNVDGTPNNKEPSDIMWTWKSKYMAKLEKSDYW